MASPFPGLMTDIRPERIDFTVKAANKRDFLITKHNGDNTMEELLAIVAETEAENEGELVEALKSANVEDEAIEVAKTIARLSNAYSDELPMDVVAKSLGVELSDNDEETEEEITKSDLDKLPDALREKVASLKKTATEYEDRISSLEQAVEKSAREKLLDAYIAKAEKLDKIPGATDEIAERLLTIHENLGEDAATELYEKFAAANEAVDSSAFGEVGSSNAGGGSDAYDRIEKAAKSIEAEEDVPFHKALDLATRRNPELAREYEREMQSR